MKTNFYLKDPKTTGQTTIIASVHFNDLRFKYPSGYSISPKDWNVAARRAKKSHRDHMAVNTRLDEIQSLTTDYYNKATLNSEYITVDKFRDFLDLALNRIEPEKVKGFMEYWNEYIDMKRASNQHRTIQKYNTVLGYIVAVSKVNKIPLTWDNMKKPFYEKYIQYRLEAGASNETYFKEIAMLKAFISWGLENEYHTNVGYIKVFKCPSKTDKEVFFLEESELFQLYNYDFMEEELDGCSLNEIKDIFCFSAL